MATSLDESIDSSVPEPSSLEASSAVTDSSLDLDSSVTDTSSQKQSVDDTSKDEVEGEASKDFEDDSDDDELIALRIAALESIKVAQAKVSKENVSHSDETVDTESSMEDDRKKAGYVIETHKSNANLVSIMTDKTEIEYSIHKPPPNLSRPPPMIVSSVYIPSLETLKNIPPPNMLPRPLSPGSRPWRDSRPYRSRSPPSPYARRRSLSPSARYYSPNRRSPPQGYGRVSPSRYSPDGRITPTKRLTPTRQTSPPNRRSLTPTRRRLTTPPMRRGSPGGAREWSPIPRREPPYIQGSRRSPFSYNKNRYGGRSPRGGGRHGQGGAHRPRDHYKNNPNREPLRPRQDNRQNDKKVEEGTGKDNAEKEGSASEWETDTDPPTDDDETSTQEKSIDAPDKSQDNTSLDKSQDPSKPAELSQDAAKENAESSNDNKEKTENNEEAKDAVAAEINESKETSEVAEQSQDDVLKLDASAEVDEFAMFLEEIEEDLKEKKEVKKEEPKPEPEKKARIETERKTVDGKKMRKKIKPKKERTPSFSDEESSTRNYPPGHRFSQERRVSSGSRVFQEDRRRDSRGREDNRASRGRDEDNRGSRGREGNNGRNSKGRDQGEEKKESSTERREREEKEYNEKLAKLDSPERERLEARRKKFENKGEVAVSKAKKISLKRDTDELDEEDVRSRLSKKRPARSYQDDERDDWGDGEDVRKANNVTDLRVQLHKKKQARGVDDNQESRKSSERSNRKSTERNGRKVRIGHVDDSVEFEDLVDDDLEDERLPTLQNTHRVIMPPMFSKDEEIVSEGSEASDRSPSPPPQKSRKKSVRKVKTRNSSGSAADEIEKLGLHELGFTEEEIQEEIEKLKQMKSKSKDKKKDKKEKKEKRKKKKKDKSSSKSVKKRASAGSPDPDDSLEYFERALEEEELNNDLDEILSNGSRSKSGSRNRFSSGESISRPTSSLSDELKNTIRAESSERWKNLGGSLGSRLKMRLGQKVQEEKRDTDLQPLRKLKRKSKEILNEGEESGEELLKKMRKKNRQREERAKEIALDKEIYG